MAGEAVSWSSKLQATVTLLTVEAEYMVITCAAQHALWMHAFLGEIRLDQPLPTTLYCDNTSAIALALSTKGHQHAKHIDICHHCIHKHVSSGQITLQHIPSVDKIADVFMKALTKALHVNNMKGLFHFWLCLVRQHLGEYWSKVLVTKGMHHLLPFMNTFGNTSYFIFVISFHQHSIQCHVYLLYSSSIIYCTVLQSSTYAPNFILLTSVVIHIMCLTRGDIETSNKNKSRRFATRWMVVVTVQGNYLNTM